MDQNNDQLQPQQKYMTILLGTGRNNFIIEWNDEREEDISEIMAKNAENNTENSSPADNVENN